MARVKTIDSGVVSTRIAKQQNETALPEEPVWMPVEVDTYEPTGSEVGTEAPLPISSRQTHPTCLLYTSPSPRDRTRSRMPSSA